MGLDVDEARRHGQALGIDDFARLPRQGRADGGNAACSESNISDGTLAAAAVDEKTAMDHDIQVMAVSVAATLYGCADAEMPTA